MKRHTNKHREIFGLIVAAVAALGLGVLAQQMVWADDTQTSEVNVQFTFGSVLSLTADKETISIEGLAPGTSKESDPVTVTVDTNNTSGFYVSATAGTSSTNTDLVGDGEAKFTHLGTEETKSKLEDLADNTWGISYQNDEYTGLPQDGNDQGETGKKILDVSTWNGAKTVKVKVGAKAGATLPAGTYKNVINFYAVTK